MLPQLAISQNPSLTRNQVLSEIAKAKHDTVRVKLYIDQARVLAGRNGDSVLYWMNKGRSIAEANIALYAHRTDEESVFIRKRLKRFKVIFLNKAAMIQQNNGNLSAAMQLVDSALVISKQLNDNKLIARSYNAVAIIKTYQGNVKEALSNYDEARKIYLAMNDKSGIVTILINQAVIFSNMDEMENCIIYYREAIQLARKEGLKDSEGGALANLAGVLVQEKDHESARECIERGMQLAKEMSDPDLEARFYYTMGVMNYDNSDFDEAYRYFTMAKEIEEKMKNYMSLSNTLSSISNVFHMKKDYKKAIQFSEQAHRMNLEMGSPYKIGVSANSLYGLYKKVGNTDKSLEFLELSVKMKDSVQNEGNRREAIHQHLKNEFERKAAADSVVRAKERELKNAELAKRNAELKVKKNEQYGLFAGLLVVLIFGVMMYNRFKVSQKQKRIIEEQKKEVERQKEEMGLQKQLLENKQKEVIDSIKYARKIQMALMPSEKRIGTSLGKLRK